jgi:hypothetical protein
MPNLNEEAPPEVVALFAKMQADHFRGWCRSMQQYQNTAKEPHSQTKFRELLNAEMQRIRLDEAVGNQIISETTNA